MCVCALCVCLWACVCLCVCACVCYAGAKSNLCVCAHVCVCVSESDCVHAAGRECYDINLLGTGSAVCWHVPPFHADNVKYLSTGVCGHPDNQGKTGLLIHKYRWSLMDIQRDYRSIFIIYPFLSFICEKSLIFNCKKQRFDRKRWEMTRNNIHSFKFKALKEKLIKPQWSSLSWLNKVGRDNRTFSVSVTA